MEADPEADAEVESEQEAGLAADDELDAAVVSDPLAEAEAEAEAEPEVEAELEADATAEAEAEVEPEADRADDVEVAAALVSEDRVDAETIAETETESDVEAEAETEVEAALEAEAAVDTDVDAEPEAEAEAELDADTEADPEAEAEAEPDADRADDADIDPAVVSHGLAETEAEADAEAEAEVEPHAEAEAVAEAGTDAEPEPAVEAAAPADDAPERIARPRVVATGPMILGRSRPEVMPLSPALQRVRDVVASIAGTLAGGPHSTESGLHWAAGLLVSPTEEIVVVTSSDAGWLPPRVLIPADVRVLWNVPGSHRWAAVDDPVRGLLEYAQDRGYLVEAVATTHPSRAYSPVVAGNLVGVTRVGPVIPGGLNRFEAVVSPVRRDHIRSLSPVEAARQTRALLRDLEQMPIAAENAIGFELARTDARRFLDSHTEIPLPLLEQLHIDDEALTDALCLGRIPARADDLGQEPPEAEQLRDRLLERAVLAATMAACYFDVESAVYAWTFAKFLASQRPGTPGTT